MEKKNYNLLIFMNYPLSLNTWDKKQKKAIQDVINSNNFTMGKKVSEFEKKFAKNLIQNMQRKF